ncbi:DUF2188 domain-containing protein [Mycoplasma marinum]|uniref:DUF2188 domain-containing protein n=1 Tax=Mycoplasma marinum TaxID=1937190 RepID=A0A4R0XM69_9MOLU|nr:DUF2188 domain-containing protein [Mycoplasma marinum]TCG11799.1 hypothetical protein C4B24_01385 [Mycoplasma marinum]
MAVKYITRRIEDKKWCVKNAKAEKATRVFKTQKEAIDYAKTLKSTTSIMIQGRDGKFRKASAWNTIKKAPVATTKSTTSTKKTTKPNKELITKKTNSAPIKEELSKEITIEELKKQNAVLDKQIAEEKAIKNEENEKELDKNKSEEDKINKDKKSKVKNEKTIGKKIAMFLGVVFLLAVITISILLVLDWQEKITFINWIK